MSAEEPTDATLANTAQPAPPSDQEALTMEIERTREELGQTVEALVAKTDLKARSREKVAEVKQQVTANAGPVREKVSSQAAKATATVRQAAPEPVQRAAKRAADTAGQRRVQVLVAAGAALVAGWLLLRRRRR